MPYYKTIMTTTSNIITLWTPPTDGTTTQYMTQPTSTTRPTWSNVYEITTTNTTPNTSSSMNLNATTNNFVPSNDIEGKDSDSEVIRSIEYIGTVLSFYYVPIIVSTGSIGNILSVFVFFKTKLRKLSSSYYLAALAVSDTCFLLGLFAQWLNFVEVHIYNREYFCQFFTFFSNLACFCSVWFVVAFTVERFIVVRYPLRRQAICMVRRAKMVLISIVMLGCLHCAPFLFSSTPVYSSKLETTICDIRSEYKDYITLLNYWDTIVVFAVPFATIAVLNTFTGYTVWKFATVRRTLVMQKMNTHHLPLHGTISSPSSFSSARESSSAAIATSTRGAKTAMFQKQGISTYRITTSLLKRQKSTSFVNSTHWNGQHNHRQHHKHHHIHSHPNRATKIKQSANGNSYYGNRFAPNSSQLKVTKILLIVSTVFVCLNLPSFIMRMITYLEVIVDSSILDFQSTTRVVLKQSALFHTNGWINGGLFLMDRLAMAKTQSSTNEKTTVVLQYIFQLLFITNFGINFVLYCLSGQNFRKAVLSMFCNGSSKQRDGGISQITVTECYRNNGGAGAACGANTSTRRRMMTQYCCNEIH